MVGISIHAERREDAPFLPRFGLRMFLPRQMDAATYFGYGPQESYVDKHRATTKHLYRAKVSEMHEDYLRPQENGSHYNCNYLKVDGFSGASRSAVRVSASTPPSRSRRS